MPINDNINDIKLIFSFSEEVVDEESILEIISNILLEQIKEERKTLKLDDNSPKKDDNKKPGH